MSVIYNQWRLHEADDKRITPVSTKQHANTPNSCTLISVYTCDVCMQTMTFVVHIYTLTMCKVTIIVYTHRKFKGVDIYSKQVITCYITD